MILGFANGVLSNPQIAISGNAYPAILTHANTTVKTYTLPNTTGTVLLDNNVLGYALPALTTGFLNWTGSAWAFSAAGGSVSTTDVTTTLTLYPVMATAAGGSTFETASTKLFFDCNTIARLSTLEYRSTLNSSTYAQFFGSNLSGTGYWGIGSTTTPNIVRLGSVDSSGTNWNPVAGMALQIDGAITTTVASAIPAISMTRSDLSNTITLTQSSANIITSTAQIVLPYDPTTALQSATKQYVDNTIAYVQPSAVAAAVGGWQSYTPIWTSNGTAPSIGNGTLTGKYRRIGDSIELVIAMTMGSTTSFGTGTYYWSLPTGLTIANDPQTVYGVAEAYHASAITNGFSSSSSGNLIAVLGSYTVTNTAPFTWVSGDTFNMRASVHVDQYSANINLLTNFTEYAYNTSATTANDSTSFGNDPGGVLVQSFAPAGTAFITKRIRFTKTILSTDIVIFEIWDGILWKEIHSTPMQFGVLTNGTLFYGVYLNSINSTDIDVYFASKADGLGQAWSVYNGASYKWRIRKISNGNFAQGSPSYSQTIGDGTNSTIVVIHNLGVTDCNVAIWELTGNKRKIDASVEIQNTSSTQVTLKFLTAPALNSLRVDVFSSGGTSLTTSDTFSATETLTNKVWINGKPIYRKTISCGALPNNTTKNIAHGITGMTEITDIYGISNNGSSWINLPFVNPANIIYCHEIAADFTNIILVTASDRTQFTVNYVTIEYTK